MHWDSLCNEASKSVTKLDAFCNITICYFTLRLTVELVRRETEIMLNNTGHEYGLPCYVEHIDLRN